MVKEGWGGGGEGGGDKTEASHYKVTARKTQHQQEVDSLCVAMSRRTAIKDPFKDRILVSHFQWELFVCACVGGAY